MDGLRATALLLLLALAGCSGPEPGTTTGSPVEGADVITDPRDLSYLDDATPGSHIHDYWNGRSNLTVLAEEGSVWSACYGSCSQGMAGAWRRPAEGLIVPQGTKWVNGTFSFTPHPEHDATGFELWVKTAQDAATVFLQELRPGEPFSIMSAQERNDPPHYALSLWEFEVLAKGAPDAVVFRGDFRWRIEAVRGLPLTPYPPHPDRWDGADELPLLEDQRTALLYYEEGGTRTCYSSVSGCPGLHTMPDGAVVPHDATTVQVRIVSTTPLVGLEFHGADAWTFRPVAGRQEGADTVFDIALDGTLGDSPYATQSLWEFVVVLDQPQPAVEAWSGTYTIAVKALR